MDLLEERTTLDDEFDAMSDAMSGTGDYIHTISSGFEARTLKSYTARKSLRNVHTRNCCPKDISELR